MINENIIIYSKKENIKGNFILSNKNDIIRFFETIISKYNSQIISQNISVNNDYCKQSMTTFSSFKDVIQDSHSIYSIEFGIIMSDNTKIEINLFEHETIKKSPYFYVECNDKSKIKSIIEFLYIELNLYKKKYVKIINYIVNLAIVISSMAIYISRINNLDNNGIDISLTNTMLSVFLGVFLALVIILVRIIYFPIVKMSQNPKLIDKIKKISENNVLTFIITIISFLIGIIGTILSLY